MKIRAHAKINLSLDITGRRDDGYHLVRMVMQALELHDTLRMEKLSSAGILLETDRKDLAADESNLVFRAAKLMLDTFRPEEGVKISLAKRIPLAAGLAGGSADAAAALRGMNELFAIGLDDTELCRFGLRLGADVPFCLTGGTALSEGIGEILTPLAPLPDCFIVLAKPRAEVSTAETYRAYDSGDGSLHPDTEGLIRALEYADLDGVCARLANVLEPVTSAVHPEVTRIREQLQEAGADGACMSGSGPTVFGIFREKKKAEHACDLLKREPFREVILTCPARNGRMT